MKRYRDGLVSYTFVKCTALEFNYSHPIINYSQATTERSSAYILRTVVSKSRHSTNSLKTLCVLWERTFEWFTLTVRKSLHAVTVSYSPAMETLGRVHWPTSALPGHEMNIGVLPRRPRQVWHETASRKQKWRTHWFECNNKGWAAYHDHWALFGPVPLEFLSDLWCLVVSPEIMLINLSIIFSGLEWKSCDLIHNIADCTPLFCVYNISAEGYETECKGEGTNPSKALRFSLGYGKGSVW